jgi:branched-chain amino acid transport system substrate-binding protein
VEAILPITERNQVVVISPAATASSLSGRKGFFRTIVSDVYDGTAMAEFAFQKRGSKKIAVLHVEAAGPGGVARSFIVRFKELGGAVPLVETALPNATDFRAQLTKIKAAEPDAVYFAAYAVETGTILKQAKELGLKKQMLSHQLAEDPEVRARAGDAANGLIYTTPKLDPATGGPAVKEFYEKFRAKYGEEPRNFASNSYDALKLLARAIAQNGYSLNGITKGLLAIKHYPAASGTLSFDSNGDVIQPMRIMTIREGKVEEYRP